MTSIRSGRIRNLMILVVTILLACAVDLVASALLRHPPAEPWQRIAIALLPLPGDIAIIVLALQGIRRLDDFQKRVHFEAVTFAFLATGVGVFLYGYLQKAMIVGPFHAGSIWLFMLVSYAAGYLLAARRYR